MGMSQTYEENKGPPEGLDSLASHVDLEAPTQGIRLINKCHNLMSHFTDPHSHFFLFF